MTNCLLDLIKIIFAEVDCTQPTELIFYIKHFIIATCGTKMMHLILTKINTESNKPFYIHMCNNYLVTFKFIMMYQNNHVFSYNGASVDVSASPPYPAIGWIFFIII